MIPSQRPSVAPRNGRIGCRFMRARTLGYRRTNGGAAQRPAATPNPGNSLLSSSEWMTTHDRRSGRLRWRARLRDGKPRWRTSKWTPYFRGVTGQIRRIRRVGRNGHRRGSGKMPADRAAIRVMAANRSSWIRSRSRNRTSHLGILAAAVAMSGAGRTCVLSDVRIAAE
jgi:hypothetical protein